MRPGSDWRGSFPLGRPEDRVRALGEGGADLTSPVPKGRRVTRFHQVRSIHWERLKQIYYILSFFVVSDFSFKR